MTSLAARYQAGEWEAVWHDIRTTAISDLVTDDVAEVASLTMRRARTQVDDLVSKFVDLGLRSAAGTPVVTPPPPDVASRITVVEQTTGPLPAALRALVTHVGSVSLMGDLRRVGLFYDAPRRRRITTMPPGPPYVDPLYLPGIEHLERDVAEYLGDPESQGPVIPFAFAPDELHKAAISGSEHGIVVPSEAPDPVIEGVAGRPGVTLVTYLRLSVAWGGLPGYSFAPHLLPRRAERLRAEPAF